MRQSQITSIICVALSYAFEAVLGLKINLTKSKPLPVGAMEDVEGLARILGSRASPMPMKYMCLPLGASFKAKSIQDGIIKKMEHCLVGCKRICLFKGGRITLIKSTLSNFPTYYLSLFPSMLGKQLNKNKNLLPLMADNPVVEEEGYSEGVLDAMELIPTLGLTVRDDEKKSLFTIIEADRARDPMVSVSNTKGKGELKNLECSINFETRGCGSSRVKGRVF